MTINRILSGASYQRQLNTLKTGIDFERTNFRHSKWTCLLCVCLEIVKLWYIVTQIEESISKIIEINYWAKNNCLLALRCHFRSLLWYKFFCSIFTLERAFARIMREHTHTNAKQWALCTRTQFRFDNHGSSYSHSDRENKKNVAIDTSTHASEPQSDSISNLFFRFFSL